MESLVKTALSAPEIGLQFFLSHLLPRNRVIYRKTNLLYRHRKLHRRFLITITINFYIDKKELESKRMGPNLEKVHRTLSTVHSESIEKRTKPQYPTKQFKNNKEKHTYRRMPTVWRNTFNIHCQDPPWTRSMLRTCPEDDQDKSQTARGGDQEVQGTLDIKNPLHTQSLCQRICHWRLSSGCCCHMWLPAPYVIGPKPIFPCPKFSPTVVAVKTANH